MSAVRGHLRRGWRIPAAGAHPETAQGVFFDPLLVLFAELRKLDAVVGTFFILSARDVSALSLGYGAGTFVQRIVAVHYIQDVLGAEAA